MHDMAWQAGLSSPSSPLRQAGGGTHMGDGASAQEIISSSPLSLSLHLNMLLPPAGGDMGWRTSLRRRLAGRRLRPRTGEGGWGCVERKHEAGDSDSGGSWRWSSSGSKTALLPPNIIIISSPSRTWAGLTWAAVEGREAWQQQLKNSSSPPSQTGGGRGAGRALSLLCFHHPPKTPLSPEGHRARRAGAGRQQREEEALLALAGWQQAWLEGSSTRSSHGAAGCQPWA